SSTLPPPPSSPLFPYTTLFRSGAERDADVVEVIVVAAVQEDRAGDRFDGVDAFVRRRRRLCALFRRRPRRRSPAPIDRRSRRRRSEEHTSELQSLTNLVCRLLL